MDVGLFERYEVWVKQDQYNSDGEEEQEEEDDDDDNDDHDDDDDADADDDDGVDEGVDEGVDDVDDGVDDYDYDDDDDAAAAAGGGGGGGGVDDVDDDDDADDNDDEMTVTMTMWKWRGWCCGDVRRPVFRWDSGKSMANVRSFSWWCEVLANFQCLDNAGLTAQWWHSTRHPFHSFLQFSFGISHFMSGSRISWDPKWRHFPHLPLPCPVAENGLHAFTASCYGAGLHPVRPPHLDGGIQVFENPRRWFRSAEEGGHQSRGIEEGIRRGYPCSTIHTRGNLYCLLGPAETWWSVLRIELPTSFSPRVFVHMVGTRRQSTSALHQRFPRKEVENHLPNM